MPGYVQLPLGLTHPVIPVDKNGDDVGTQTNPLFVQITDGTSDVEISPGPYLPTIETSHWRVHQKQHFTATHYDNDVDIATPLVIRFQTPASPANKQYHWTAQVLVSADCTVELLEDTTFTGTTGTTITQVNNNRLRTLGTSDAVVSYGDTINAAGTTLMGPVFIPGGSKNSAVGGESGHTEEWLLEPGHEYVIRVTALNDNTHVSVVLFWYEFTV